MGAESPNGSLAQLAHERTMPERYRIAALIGAMLCGALGLGLGLPQRHSSGLAALGSLRAGDGAPVALGDGGPLSRLAPSMPGPAALPRVSEEVGAGDPTYWPRYAQSGTPVARGGGLHATFTAMGARFSVKGDDLGLHFDGVGHAARGSQVSPRIQRDAVVYTREGLSEFYRSGPAGIEQSFTVAGPPRAGGPLVLDFRMSGSLLPHASGSNVVFQRPGSSTTLRYGKLAAVDASGRRLPARVELTGGLLRLRVAAAHARYPVRIDPFLEQGKLKNVGAKGLAGWSVALSGDGRTALIGAPAANGLQGAASVFTRAGSTWRQTATLTADGETGAGEFGGSVSLSADGNTALIGAPYEDEHMGGAWLFTRAGSTWSQAARLAAGEGERGRGQFGASVALSGDGGVAVVGAPDENSAKGGAWVFTGSGSSWTASAGPLMDSGEEAYEGQFGYSVAASGNGEVVLVGEPYENTVWSFTRSGTQWLDGTKLLQPSRGAEELALFGWSVALSANGDIALIGAPHAKASVGAGWAFKRSADGGWRPEGTKLVGTDKLSHYEGGNESPVYGDVGDSVALAADGKTAIMGGQGYRINDGAAWLFKWTGSKWRRTGRLKGGHESIEGYFGASVALAGNGKLAIIGGPRDQDNRGSVWTFSEVHRKTPPEHRRERPARHAG